ncbi:hypothetical protein TSUD_240050 [Trifolium subterraneum]|uniref:Protein kinase domain-containing protein n=1 Tax=Trifolium subterraneum TaxID=3900 RepID=A0A2Z6PH23_TRISU|nr:hypothetical protein TSUD_240050 [Trifolium subterraneum]
MHHSVSDSEPSCQSDVLTYLNEILTLGIEVEWDQALTQDTYFTNCSNCINNNGFCGFNSSDPNQHFLCYQSRSTFSPPWIRKTKLNKIAIFAIIIAFASLILFLSVIISILRSRKLNTAVEEDPTTVFLHNHRNANLFPPVFTYDELNISTNNFDPKRKIGDGGFGSVYLGNLRDGKLAAVKHLHRQNHTAAFSSKSFCNEILILSSIDHPNLVKLHGYCSDPRGLILVYDYIPNGTLAEHLHGLKSKRYGYKLTWQTRLEIAIQTALAMEYLHFSVKPPIVHRDITSSNIFIEKDMRIKVGNDGEMLSAVAAVAELAFRCVASDKDDRPDSKEVVEELKRVRLRTSMNGDVAKGIVDPTLEPKLNSHVGVVRTMGGRVLELTQLRMYVDEDYSSS